jgi:hypothetical protein
MTTRMMTLQEFVETLPEIHTAREEYAALRAEVARLQADLTAARKEVAEEQAATTYTYRAGYEHGRLEALAAKDAEIEAAYREGYEANIPPGNGCFTPTNAAWLASSARYRQRWSAREEGK